MPQKGDGVRFFFIVASLQRGSGCHKKIAPDDSREFGFHNVTFATSDKSGWNIDWGDGMVQNYDNERNKQ